MVEFDDIATGNFADVLLLIRNIEGNQAILITDVTFDANGHFHLAEDGDLPRFIKPGTTLSPDVSFIAQEPGVSWTNCVIQLSSVSGQIAVLPPGEAK